MPKQAAAGSKKKIVKSKGGRKISTPVGILIVLVIGLLLAITGTYGYTKYKERDLQAKAAKWKELKPLSAQRDGGDGVKFVGCREYTDIGPDNQQGKNVKVTILASKPKGLKYSGKTSKFYDGQPSLTVLKKTTNGSTGLVSYRWWNDELAILQYSDLKVGDKLTMHVRSDASFVDGFYGRDGFDTKNKYAATIDSKVKRIYYPSMINDASYFQNKKQQQNAEKNFDRNLISVAQLPNCN